MTNIILFKMSFKSIIQFYLANSLDIRFLRITLNIERVFAGEHLENHNTESPHVNSLAVSLASPLLWCHVKNGSHDFINITIIIENVRMDFCGKTEVCYLGYISFLWIVWIGSIR